MTKITKPVIRETDYLERTTPLLIELHPRRMVLRFKNTRSSLSLDYGAVLDLARKLDARKHL
jgi:hypothetical protein